MKSKYNLSNQIVMYNVSLQFSNPHHIIEPSSLECNQRKPEIAIDYKRNLIFPMLTCFTSFIVAVITDVHGGSRTGGLGFTLDL